MLKILRIGSIAIRSTSRNATANAMNPVIGILTAGMNPGRNRLPNMSAPKERPGSRMAFIIAEVVILPIKFEMLSIAKVGETTSLFFYKRVEEL